VGLLAGLVLFSACEPPVRVRRVDAHRQLTSNVLSTGDMSRRTQNLVYDRDLVERFHHDPAGALAALHVALLAGQLTPDETAGVAELAFLHAENGGGRPYYLAAALYAWLHLFPDDPKAVPSRWSPRFRLACDLYNRGLTEGLKNGENVELRSGTLPLPFGELVVELAPDADRWGAHQLTSFVPVAELEVKGFPTYYRWPGLGAPLAAGVVSQGERDQDLLGRRVRVAVTALLRLERLRAQMAARHVRGRLETYPGYDETEVTIVGNEVPLEAEPTAAMALTLAETKIWDLEASGFLRGAGVIEKRAQLVSMRPYRRGLIPFFADLPVAPGVAARSIIAVKDGVPSKTAADGVVKYESAHIDGVESELVVKSPHSCQSNPHTIAEAKRILLEHLKLNRNVVPK
jgi:hypothetical protein